MIAMYSPGQRPCGASVTFSSHLAKIVYSHILPFYQASAWCGPLTRCLVLLTESVNDPVTPSNVQLRNNPLSSPARLSQCCLIDTDISTWCSFSRSTCVLSASLAWHHDDNQQQSLSIRQAGRKPVWMLSLSRQWSLKTVPSLLSDVQFRFLHVGKSEV